MLVSLNLLKQNHFGVNDKKLVALNINSAKLHAAAANMFFITSLIKAPQMRSSPVCREGFLFLPCNN